MKFDAENQHAEAFKCRGFDGYNAVDPKAATDLIQKGTEWAQSEQGKKTIQAGKDLLAFKRRISARRNPDEEVLEKCGKKPLRKKKQGAWNKCREETLAARAAAEAGGDSGSEVSNENTERSSIITGGTPTPNKEKSQRPMDDTKKPFDWAKNWWVLPLGLGVLYLGYTKFIKKK